MSLSADNLFFIMMLWLFIGFSILEDVSTNFKNRNGKRSIRALQRPRNNYKEANGKAFGLLTPDELSPESKIFKV